MIFTLLMHFQYLHHFSGIICIGGDGIVNEVSHFAALVIIVVSGCLSSNPLFCIFYKFLSSPHSFPGM